MGVNDISLQGIVFPVSKKINQLESCEHLTLIKKRGSPPKTNTRTDIFGKYMI